MATGTCRCCFVVCILNDLLLVFSTPQLWSGCGRGRRGRLGAHTSKIPENELQNFVWPVESTKKRGSNLAIRGLRCLGVNVDARSRDWCPHLPRFPKHHTPSPDFHAVKTFSLCQPTNSQGSEYESKEKTRPGLSHPAHASVRVKAMYETHAVQYMRASASITP